MRKSRGEVGAKPEVGREAQGGRRGAGREERRGLRGTGEERHEELRVRREARIPWRAERGAGEQRGSTDNGRGEGARHEVGAEVGVWSRREESVTSAR